MGDTHFKLKKNSPEFDVVDGPMTGQQFRHGKTYTEIPPGDKSRFEKAETRHAVSPQNKSAGKTDATPPKKSVVSEADKTASDAKSKGGS